MTGLCAHASAHVIAKGQVVQESSPAAAPCGIWHVCSVGIGLFCYVCQHNICDLAINECLALHGVSHEVHGLLHCHWGHTVSSARAHFCIVHSGVLTSQRLWVCTGWVSVSLPLFSVASGEWLIAIANYSLVMPDQAAVWCAVVLVNMPP